MLWTPLTDIPALVEHLDVDELQSLDVQFRGPPSDTRFRDVGLLLNWRTLVSIKLSVRSRYKTALTSIQFNTAFSGLLRCSQLKKIYIRMPDTPFIFDADTLYWAVSCWSRAEVLILSFPTVSEGVTLHEVFELTARSSLTTLHIPIIKTVRMGTFWFSLPPAAPTMSKLSSDCLHLDHNIVDVAIAIGASSGGAD